jgi:hypothetical protein
MRDYFDTLAFAQFPQDIIHEIGKRMVNEEMIVRGDGKGIAAKAQDRVGRISPSISVQMQTR